MIKKDVKIDKKYGYLVVDGKYYDVTTVLGRPTFKKINISEIKAKLKKAEKIAEALKTKVNVKAILKESVMKIDLKDINKLYKIMFESKKKFTPKTREHHCVDVTVGNFILPIVD